MRFGIRTLNWSRPFLVEGCNCIGADNGARAKVFSIVNISLMFLVLTAHRPGK